MRRFVAVGFLAALFQTGCACQQGSARHFQPGKDTFAFRNELRWTYEFTESGEVLTEKINPPPEYSLRCFPIVRAAREFFYHAQFRPDLEAVSPAEYRALTKEVLARSSRCPSPADERIIIPGFRNLHEFSAAHDAILRGVAHRRQSYFQRGNWRMVLPVTKRGQRKAAERFLREVKAGWLPIAHVYRFPNTTLNHALLIYSAEEQPGLITFQAYDPNEPERAAALSFDRERNTFLFGRNRYFAGGPVRTYEVYRGIAF